MPSRALTAWAKGEYGLGAISLGFGGGALLGRITNQTLPPIATAAAIPTAAKSGSRLEGEPSCWVSDDCESAFCTVSVSIPFSITIPAAVELRNFYVFSGTIALINNAIQPSINNVPPVGATAPRCVSANATA